MPPDCRDLSSFHTGYIQADKMNVPAALSQRQKNSGSHILTPTDDPGGFVRQSANVL